MIAKCQYEYVIYQLMNDARKKRFLNLKQYSNIVKFELGEL